MAKGSWSIYQRAIDALSAFLTQFNIEGTLPISPVVLGFFISYMHNKQYAASTIETYVSAIGFVHKLYDEKDPSGSFIVKKAIQGVKKDRPTADVRLPITQPILHKLVDAIHHCADTLYKQTMYASMFRLAFAAFLRVGEMAMSHKNEDNILALRDITRNQESGGIRITFRKFKHSGGRKKVVEIARQQRSCPVQALEKYLHIRGQQPGYLFQWPTGKAVKREEFNRILQSTLNFCQLDPLTYKTHSFRIGAATHAASLGYSKMQLQEMGRWRSDAFLKYVRF